MRRLRVVCVLAAGIGLLGASSALAQTSAPIRVLAFHGPPDATVDAGLAALAALGDANGFVVQGTQNASDFSSANLSTYRAVVFLNNDGDRLNSAQEAALQSFIQGGGGFVGIGRAAEAEPGSAFVTGLIGARPDATSPTGQSEQVVVFGDRVHPATKGLPLEWTRDDVWYRWNPRPTGEVHTVARYRAPGAPAGDGTATGGTDWPISWCRDFQGGRSFYTGMGRTAAGYAQANLRTHLLGAIQWSAGMVRGGCKATIAANYHGERLVSGASGDLAHTGESHGVALAPNGWAIYIGRADCRTNAQRGAMIGVPSTPRILDFANRNVGVGCGNVHIWDPAQYNGTVNSGVTLAGVLPVYGDRGSGNEINGKIEAGLLGIAVSPDFAQTGHIYLQYFPTFNPDNPVHPGLADGDQRRITKMGKPRVSRFTIDLATKQLKLNSEVVIFEYESQIYSCCHRGGGMGFDSEGNLYVTTGDSNSSQSTNGYSGNFQPARCPTGDPTQASNNHCGNNAISYNDARRTAGSSNDYNGKMLRLNPIETIPDGAQPAVGIGTTYTLPNQDSPNGPNLFSGSEGDGSQARPEIYAMGLRNPSRLFIDPETDIPYSAWVGPDAGSPSATQGPSTYESASQLPRAGNYGWPYCMGNQQAYRDRIETGALRTTNAAGYVTGGPAASPTQGWYDCKNLVNDSTNNTGLTVLPHATGTGRDAGTARPHNVWYSRGNPGNNNGCPSFPREQGADGAPNYGATPTSLCPYLTASGATVFNGPVYRYDDDAEDNSARWPEYWDGRWFLHDFGNASAKHALLLDPATDQDGGQPIYADSFRGVLNWEANYMDSKFGPDGALYVQVYQGFFTTGAAAGLYRFAYTGGPDTPGPDPRWNATATPRQIQFSLGASGGVAYEWNFGDGSPTSTEANPAHVYANTGMFDVTLTVTYADGEKLSETTRVTVGDDAAAPTTTVQINGAAPVASYGAPVEVSLRASDGAGGTGVEWTEYRIDGGAYTRRENTDSADPFVTTFTVGGAGAHTVEFRSRDRSGNVEDPPGSVSFTINLGGGGSACLPQSDEFDGTVLDEKWTVLRPAGGGPVVSEGSLRLPILQGDFIANDPLASNTLLQDAPAGEWTVTTRLDTSGINANGEQAGLVIWKSETPRTYSKIVAIQANNGSHQFEHIVTQSGSVNPPIAQSITPAPGGQLPAQVLLRARYDGQRVIGEFSPDEGATWTLIGQINHAAPLAAPLRVGPVAFRGANGGGTASFDWLRVHAGAEPDGPVTCGTPGCPQADEFDGTALDPKWEIVNPNAANLTVGGGNLRLRTAQGDVSGGSFTAQNILLQEVPAGPWTVTTKLDHRAIAVNGQAAGLVIFGSRNPNYFAKTAVQYKNTDLSGNPLNGIWVERILTTNGTRNGSYGGEFPNTGKLTPTSNDLWIRARYDGTDVFTEYSFDGETWAASAPPFPASVLGANGVTKLGLFVKHDGGGPAADVDFDWFRVEAASCDGRDTSPPRTTHALDPAQPNGDGGWYRSEVEVTLDASDNEGGSGVELTEYRFAGAQAWTRYTAPFTVDEDGRHTIEYRSTDKEGNTETIRSVSFRIDSAKPTTTARINGQAPAASYDGPVQLDLDATDGDGSGVRATQIRIDGGEWQPYVEEEVILNSQQDLAQWAQAGPGGLNWVDQDGGFARTTGGLGMPWYPVKDYGDFSLKLQWRDSGTGATGNGGVFVRFPHPEEAVARPASERFPCQVGSAQTQPAWVAIFCGHEIQINDNQTSEPQKTGSVYNFSPLNATQARVQPRGTWVDYEVRVEGQTYTIVRNGEVLQVFENTPDKPSSRAGDPSTSDRQFNRGYIGLQNHGTSDVIDYRNIRVLPLDAGSVRGPVTIEGDGRHTVEFRSTDVAGNQEDVKEVTFTIGDADTSPPVTTHALDPAAPGAGGVYQGPVGVALSATDPGASAPETHDVDAGPNSWLPNEVDAQRGDVLRWNFPASAQLPHDVWVIKPGEAPDANGTQITDGIVLPGGAPVSTTLNEAGTWTFVCKLHSIRSEGRWTGMVGTADVSEASGSGVDYTEYRVTTDTQVGEWVRSTNTGGADPFVTAFTLSQAGAHTVEYRSVDNAGNAEAVKSVSFAIQAPDAQDEVEGDVTATVPLVLSLKLGGPVTFGALVPGVARDYLASTTVTATSSAPSASLTVADRSTTATGHLVNGSFALPQPLQVSAGGPFAPLGGASTPTLLKAWSGPAANDQVGVEFKQPVAETDLLLAGGYSKRVTFTLAYTTP